MAFAAQSPVDRGHQFLALYRPWDDLQAYLKKDAERFAAAVKQTGAQLTTSEPIRDLALRFEEELDLKLAAAAWP